MAPLRQIAAKGADIAAANVYLFQPGETYAIHAGSMNAGGFDLTPDTERLLANDTIQFAVDQQPYLQGFLATLELFLFKGTRGLTGAADWVPACASCTRTRSSPT